MFPVTKRYFLSIGAAFLAGGLLAASPAPLQAASPPDRINIDWAYYNPVSILLKNKGWLEEAFAEEDVEVRWVLSLGSNKALEFLRGSSIDFGSTAGAAAVIGKAGGLPIKSIYVYSKPEWTALVTRADSGIESVEDLKGKSVAVTRGTDPHIFLLRALDSAGLSEDDIRPVLLQHPDGYRALVGRQVDAWAGLDPHMAAGELESGVRLFHRAPDLNTYGILNVRESFAEAHPETVERVLEVYERARRYALDHPDELQAALVEAAKITPEVAQKQLDERTDLSTPAIGQPHRETFIAAGEVLQKIGVIDEGTDIAVLVDELIDERFLNAVVETQ
ncbi:aliphatic sulfonate ABC transporter substrate-binding protein [Aquibaculum sediminis]|uniref:aliphatic sulfonate ABC transporter substrate-binding protein n=1 Tax=Aquibaculum sediminis TaxID=3231907 RepID=UPI0034533877